MLESVEVKPITDNPVQSNLESNCNNGCDNMRPSGLTYMKYRNLTPEEVTKLQNRVRQRALRVREGEKLPNEYSMFVLVTMHLFKNAHRYFGYTSPSELQAGLMEEIALSNESKEQILSQFKEANQKIRNIGTLKSQNRIDEQMNKVREIKEEYGSLRKISDLTGVSLKTVHKWCTSRNTKVKKRVELAEKRRKEFEQFLLQDTVTFAHPCKKYDGIRYLRNTVEETRKIYLSQPEYHRYGILSLTRMSDFRPDYIKVCGKTPLAQCLCLTCENCEKIIKSLLALGLKLVPSNRYDALTKVMCSERVNQAGTEFSFAKLACIMGNCDSCGVQSLKKDIMDENQQLLHENRSISWKKWTTPPGKKCPENINIKGSLQQGIDYLIQSIEDLGGHMFRSQWNRNWFQYIRKHLVIGMLAQIFDFSMNFRNMSQDEVQAAFWNNSQTAIHTIINYLLCEQMGCSDVVTIVVCQISEDLQHDSFFTRAAHEETFKYLAEIGVKMDTVIQFSDNCAAQYKSRRPFADLARNPLNITRVYFGERHGKSQCDGFFGRLKAWMTFNIKARHVEVNNASDFFRFCKDEYETKRTPEKCQHYRVVFQYLEPRHIRRHQDCDLEKAIKGTRSVYSVKNTPDPLKLKVRNVPCLCPPCLSNNEEDCLNSEHADPWREVTLEPKNKSSFTKKKQPYQQVSNESHNPFQHEETEEEVEEEQYNYENDSIVINSQQDSGNEGEDEEECEDFIDLTKTASTRSKDGNGELYVDLTKEVTAPVDPWSDEENMNEDPINIPDDFPNEFGNLQEHNEEIEINAHLPTFDGLEEEPIPEDIFWDSINGSFEACTSYHQLQDLGFEMKDKIPTIRPRRSVPFKIEEEFIDAVATATLPIDAPQDVDAIATIGDGNCLCRALSRAYFGDDSMHNEIRARIVIEGIVNKKYYLSDYTMERGATIARENSLTIT